MASQTASQATSQAASQTASQTASPEILHYNAFTVGGRGGNPAWVVLDASELDDTPMLAVAAEFGYSETAFFTEPLDDAGRARVRYLAPLQEVGFCDRATIAAAPALAERGAP